MRRPHIRCDCCHSLHPLTKAGAGWVFDCDWARVVRWRAPDRFPIVYVERTPPSRAERTGGALVQGLRRASAQARPRAELPPSAWLPFATDG